MGGRGVTVMVWPDNWPDDARDAVATWEAKYGEARDALEAVVCWENFAAEYADSDTLAEHAADFTHAKDVLAKHHRPYLDNGREVDVLSGWVGRDSNSLSQRHRVYSPARFAVIGAHPPGFDATGTEADMSTLLDVTYPVQTVWLDMDLPFVGNESIRWRGQLAFIIDATQKTYQADWLSFDTPWYHCAGCSERLSISARFCPKCGAALDWEHVEERDPDAVVALNEALNAKLAEAKDAVVPPGDDSPEGVA